jgi:hypothetical protein
MAKGLRSKVKKRLRAARREHFEAHEGKIKMQTIAGRLHNPYFDMKRDCI